MQIAGRVVSEPSARVARAIATFPPTAPRAWKWNASSQRQAKPPQRPECVSGDALRCTRCALHLRASETSWAAEGCMDHNFTASRASLPSPGPGGTVLSVFREPGRSRQERQRAASQSPSPRRRRQTTWTRPD